MDGGGKELAPFHTMECILFYDLLLKRNYMCSIGTGLFVFGELYERYFRDENWKKDVDSLVRKVPYWHSGVLALASVFVV